MGGRHDLEDGPFAAAQRGFYVVRHDRGERFFFLPLGMLRRQGLDPIQRKKELGIERLLRPERAVIVESRDPFRRRNKFGRAHLGHFLDESDDGFLRTSVAPGRQRLLGTGPTNGGEQNTREEGCFHFGFVVFDFLPASATKLDLTGGHGGNGGF
jgi:hypothetical protein